MSTSFGHLCPASTCSTARSIVQRSIAILIALSCLAALSVSTSYAATPGATAGPNPSDKSPYAKFPLSFEANNGQMDGQVKFVSKGDGYALFLTSTEAVFKLRTKAPTTTDGKTGGKTGSKTGSDQAPFVMRMELLGAHRAAQVSGAEPFAGSVNYFVGNDPTKWHTDIKTYGKVKYESIYPGVNAVFYGNQRQLEYDFIVASGADPGTIALGLSGVNPTLDADGNVALKAAGVDLRLQRPVVYQRAGDRKKIIQSSYTIAGNTVRFKLGKYDHNQELIIDPKFDYMTYLGGSGVDQVGASGGQYQSFGENPVYSNALAIDASGNTYVVGTTYSSDFPTKSGYEDKWAGYNGRNSTAFVSKINATGTALVYSTYLGGTASEQGTAITVDSAGNAYAVGTTQSIDFPVTKGAYITTQPAAISAFVTKLNPAGNGLVYSTYLSGKGYSYAFGVALDSKDQAYVTGNVSTPGFPVTSNALQSEQNQFAGDGFVTVLNAAGSSLLYSSLIGDDQELQFSTTAQGVYVDASGNFYVTGASQSPNLPVTKGAFQTTTTPTTGNQAFTFGFAAKFGPVTGSGHLLTYLTYLRATGTDGGDFGSAITADSEGNAYVTGYTQSATFPTTKGAYQTACLAGNMNCAFVTKLNPTGSALVWSTFLGNAGTTNEGAGQVYYVSSISLDVLENVYIAGEASSGFPEVNPIQPNINSDSVGFVTKFNPTGSALLFSSMVGAAAGGNVNWVAGSAVDALGNIYLGGGVSNGNNLPVTSGALQSAFGGGQDDGWASKIHLETPDLTIASAHTGSFKQGESAAMYTLTVSNTGDGSTSGIVTVTEDVPTGLTLESMEGAGWTCKLPSCTRTDVLTAGKSYSAITVGVDVADNAAASVVNTVKVAGGSEYNFANDAATDTTAITPAPVTPALKTTPSATTITNEEALTVAVVVETASGKATPTGTVKLTSGSYTSATTTLKAGAATIAVPAGSLAVGSDTLTVTYTPDAASSAIYNTATMEAKVSVTSALTIVVTPASLAFASLSEGSTSAAQTVTLKNTGKSAVTLGATSFTGTNIKSFVVSAKTCGTSLASGASCTLSVECKPAVTGALSATLDIADNAAGSPQMVTLKGTATAAGPVLTMSVSPASLTFASLPEGSTSAAQIVTLKNTGKSAVTLGATSFTGTNIKSFVVSAKTCGTSLAAGASCTLSVECKPAVTGPLSATLNIADDATGSPQLVTLKGTATAAAPSAAVVILPASLTFASTPMGKATAAQVVTVKNTGKIEVTLGATSFTGTNPKSFVVSAKTCAASLAAGASCTFSIECDPAVTGALSASLNVADSASGSPQLVTLKGNSTAP